MTTDAIEVIEDKPQAALAVQALTPAHMLSIVVQRGASLDEVERYMALYERWKAESARDAYTTAFAAFKAEAVTIIKNRTVDAGPLSGKKYAELFAVVNAVTPFLSKHGLSAAWKLTKDDKDWLEVTCTIRHTGGHSESVSMGGPPDTGGAKNAIQARASAVTYLERYTLKAILGLSEQAEDDDGGHTDRGDAGALGQAKYLGLPTAQRAKAIRQAAGAALEHFNVGDEPGMWAEVCHIEDNDDKNALWLALAPFSDCKSAIKRMAAEERAAQEKLEKERAEQLKAA